MSGEQSSQLLDALDAVENTQKQYAEQLGLEQGRIPFSAETLPDSRVAVRVNQDLLQEVASHMLNRAGHVSIIDERGAGKTHFRQLIYDALADGPRSDQFRVVRIKEVESITTRQFYVRLLDRLREYDDLADSGVFDYETQGSRRYPHATDEVRAIVERVADELETRDLACIVQVDQLEDATRNKRTFEQLLAALQSIGDLGEGTPVFVCFLFGTPRAAGQMDELRETLSSRLVAKDRSLARFEFSETMELASRWVAWARDEEYTDSYFPDPYTRSSIKAIVEMSDGTPRSVRQNAYHAFRAGAQQYAETGEVNITAETLDDYL
jgi:type II secretory pathway predicted ATPase ExeA